MSKVTKDQYIEDLEHDRNKLADIVIELKTQLENIVKRVPSKLLTSLVNKYPNDYKLGKVVREMSWKEDDKLSEKAYIYESPDGGKTMYRRKADDYDNKEQVDTDGNPLPTQLELF